MRKIFKPALFVFGAYLISIIVSCSSNDKTGPVLVLNGGQEFFLPLNQKYVEPGYIATDNVDGDVTKKVTISKDSIKINKVGIYKKIYKVKDKQGNESATTRNIHVYNESNLLSGAYKGTLDYPYPGSQPTTYSDSISVSDTINNLIFFKNFAGVTGNKISAKVAWRSLNGDTIAVASQTTNGIQFKSLPGITSYVKSDKSILIYYLRNSTSGNFLLQPR